MRVHLHLVIARQEVGGSALAWKRLAPDSSERKRHQLLSADKAAVLAVRMAETRSQKRGKTRSAAVAKLCSTLNVCARAPAKLLSRLKDDKGLPA